MPDLLLLGAGFSRNWGGWLATEAFEYLLGCPEITRDKSLRQLLWRHQNQGGFEAALAELQQDSDPDRKSNEATLKALESAVSRMFADMNGAFMELRRWEFQNDQNGLVRTFLARFDAIFTLNQDVLLERFYTTNYISFAGTRGWTGPELPGMHRTRPQDPMHSECWARSTWSPLPEAEFKADPRFQPLYKLHGSSNWTHRDGRRLLIMGGAKAREICQTPILNWYADVFEKSLCAQRARLMVIGYGFRDEHINAAIGRAIKQDLKLFVIAPEGAELPKRISPALEGLVEHSLIGASRRPLRDIFGGDTAEHNKVMRFFEV